MISGTKSLIIILSFFLIVSSLQVLGASQQYVNTSYVVLERSGIKADYVGQPVSAITGFTVDTDYQFITYHNYTVVLGDGIKSYIEKPGYPMLPAYTYKIEVNGYIPADDVHVYVYVRSIQVKTVDTPILPAPKPMIYGDQNKEPQYVPDEKVYMSDNYYPGKLVDTSVWHGMHGKTIIVVRYYPVQYNPLSGTLYCIDKANIYIDYGSPVPVPFKTRSLLILTTDRLVNTVEKLADFYKDKGYNVSIVTTSYIWKNYKPIENITEYPGFYNPGFNDTYYKIIASTYNWSLALRIISYLRSTLGNYDNLLIIGNSTDIPPSFYYHYPIYDPYNNWVPTDFFYASPDLDLAPNIYVGRIPFSDPDMVKAVIDKIIAWYNSGINESRDLYMTGGYPFGLSLMFGETALSTMNMHGQLSMFRVHMLTRTSMNYDRMAVLSILEGEKKALWYFALAHGSGTALADRLIIQTPSGTYMTFEILASTKDLMYMKKNPAVPIVSSVACMNAAWDDNVPSPYFAPPTFGESVLLSPAGGIAYIGSARVAAELGIMFMLLNGVETVQYYGATYLHYNILKAYSDLMGKTNATTLGYVVDAGILGYLSSTPMIDEFVLGEAFKLALLGDSNLILPVWSKPAEEASVSIAKLGNYVSEIPARLIAFYAQGYVPLYGITQKAWIALSGTEGSVGVYSVKIVNQYGFLGGYKLVNRTTVFVPSTGTYNYTLGFNEKVNGLLTLKFSIDGWGEVRVVVGAAGITLSPSNAPSGSPVNLGIYGLDLIGARTANVFVAGRLVVPDLPLKYGSAEWRFALPYLSPGTYNVTVLPSSYLSPDLISAISKFLTAEITVVKTDNLVITCNAPSIVEPGTNVTILVHTYYAGKPIDAVLKPIITGPSGETIKPTVNHEGTGLYTIIFEAEKPGRYTVSIEAATKNKYLDLKGYTGCSITAIVSAYNGFQTVSAALKNLAYNIGENLTSISTLIESNVIPAIKTNNNILNTIKNEVTGYKPILDQLLSELHSVNTSLATISGNLGTLNNKVDKIAGDLSQAKTAIINAISGLGQNITALREKLSTTTTYSEAGLAVSAIVLIAVIVLGLLKKK